MNVSEARRVQLGTVIPENELEDKTKHKNTTQKTQNRTKYVLRPRIDNNDGTSCNTLKPRIQTIMMAPRVTHLDLEYR